jgi:integrase
MAASTARLNTGAAVRWRYMSANPAQEAGSNRQPAPRPVRAFAPAEVEAISAELSPIYAPLPTFAAATGLRPEEWQATERRDVDRGERVLSVCRTVSSGKVVELPRPPAAAVRCRSPGALWTRSTALPARLDTPRLFPAPGGGLTNLDNFRRREWGPAIEASGVPTPARIYDLRSTFASTALAAGVSVFQLARIMGTSVRMIEPQYGALLDDAGAEIAGRLDAFDAEHEQVAVED